MQRACDPCYNPSLRANGGHLSLPNLSQKNNWYYPYAIRIKGDTDDDDVKVQVESKAGDIIASPLTKRRGQGTRVVTLFPGSSVSVPLPVPPANGYDYYPRVATDASYVYGTDVYGSGNEWKQPLTNAYPSWINTYFSPSPVPQPSYHHHQQASHRQLQLALCIECVRMIGIWNRTTVVVNINSTANHRCHYPSAASLVHHHCHCHSHRRLGFVDWKRWRIGRYTGVMDQALQDLA